MSWLRLCAALACLAMLAVLAVTAPARADYLEVRHSALLKQSPEREAKTRVKLSVGDQLELISGEQTNGYYRARTRSGSEGWIYRTLARRFAGELPEADGGAGDEPEPEPEPDEPDGDVVEEGPTELVPEIPAYARKAWRHWVDEDRDCQSTRQEVLIAESLAPVTYTDDERCTVASGRWKDPYSGETFTDPKALDVDHLVPLQNAHLSGGFAWSAEDRRSYANDLTEPEHLIAVSASLNRQKGAKGPEDWKPPNRDYWCQYARDWQATKRRWNLDMTVREAAAVEEMLATCGEGDHSPSSPE